jgi:hypothetical protein
MKKEIIFKHSKKFIESGYWLNVFTGLELPKIDILDKELQKDILSKKVIFKQS